MSQKTVTIDEEQINKFATIYNLQGLDMVSKIIISRMHAQCAEIQSYFLKTHATKQQSRYDTIKYVEGIYTQNYILMRELLDLKEQNDKIIELLTKISEK